MPWGALRGSAIDYRAPLSEMAALLAKLASEEAGPPVAIPEDIRTEVEIALGGAPDVRAVAAIADPVALTCPSCGGVLSQVRHGPPLRFRCQVGHAYTAETLAAEKEGGVDEAIRVALRIVEERALLTQKMAGDARRSGRSTAASIYEQRSRESRAYADVLQQAIEKP